MRDEKKTDDLVIVIGCSGSGKTYSSMLLLRQLFDVAGGGPETDAFKHLAAAFTVLRSLGSAKTQANSESSRIVILFSLHFFQPHNNGATFSFSPSIPFSLNSRDSYLVFIIYYYGI